MTFIKGIVMSPHPPIIIPEIGKGEEHGAINTIEGMKKLADNIERKKPETIIFITPHGNAFSDGLCVLDEERVSGSLGQFGRPDLKYEKNVDIQLKDAIRQCFDEKGIPSIFLNENRAHLYGVRVELDHGCIVPMYYIDKVFSNYKITHITIGMLDLMDMYKAGMALRDAVEETGRNTVIVASGDLSHRLKDDGPYSYNAMGPVFDEMLVEAIRKGDYESIVSMPAKISEPAGECGLRSIVMALGCVDSMVTEPTVYSHEGPFGVGYMTAFIEVKLGNTESILEKLKKKSLDHYREMKESEDAYIKTAREAIEKWALEGKKLSWHEIKKSVFSGRSELVDGMEVKRAGVFVSIHKNGNLRGCIGTINSVRGNVAEEIVANAISAATNDSRFAPLRGDEVDSIEIKVDVLGSLEKVASEGELDSSRYGVVVEAGHKRALLLPNLDGIDSVEKQLEVVKRKADIDETEECEIYRFEVERHEVK
ncbi:MAG: AmmeMemoRadiSam system protein A [Peptoclostridium sp.]|uniref:AmmeMemoRadiSam system protein A n=1 Tax=Peptoclostridium sp. TaxID=1904860 RepID=UPI00139E28E7|nr:AmmeMemoRadiSam system protein A [Peptoclostridium sp.]MZQ76181.1 AmmeMemoRadiSam system protein A [Peptoclostridium sp.]